MCEKTLSYCKNCATRFSENRGYDDVVYCPVCGARQILFSCVESLPSECSLGNGEGGASCAMEDASRHARIVAPNS